MLMDALIFVKFQKKMYLLLDQSLPFLEISKVFYFLLSPSIMLMEALIFVKFQKKNVFVVRSISAIFRDLQSILFFAFSIHYA
jgi:hypothetical protein